MATTWICSSVLVLGLLTQQFFTAQAGYEHSCTLATRYGGPHPKGICGTALRNTVQGVCQIMGRGYAGGGLMEQKRSVSASSDNNRQGALRGLMLNKREAFSYLQNPRNARSVRGRYGSQGITCECCYNQCTLRELVQYCN